MRRLLLATAVLSGVAAGSVSAATLIAAVETGGDVVFRATGSLDLSGLGERITGDWAASPAVYPSFPAMNVGSGGLVDAFHHAFAARLATFGAPRDGAPFFADKSWGNTVGLTAWNDPDDDYLFISPSYRSGDAFHGGLRFETTSLGDLGIAAGSSTIWTLKNGDTITLNAIPLPAAIWLSLGAVAALGGLGLATRRVEERMSPV